MAYYDDAYYALNANIASQNSMLVDLRYNYNRLLSKILTLGPDNVSDELVNEQLSIVNSIREKKQNISILEAQLTTFTPMQSPEVILQQILEQEQVSQTVQPAPEPAPELVPEPVPAPEIVIETIAQPVQETV
jgi:hypothetical protein